jgi:hypothetical protein
MAEGQSFAFVDRRSSGKSAPISDLPVLVSKWGRFHPKPGVLVGGAAIASPSRRRYSAAHLGSGTFDLHIAHRLTGSDWLLHQP